MLNSFTFVFPSATVWRKFRDPHKVYIFSIKTKSGIDPFLSAGCY